MLDAWQMQVYSNKFMVKCDTLKVKCKCNLWFTIDSTNDRNPQIKLDIHVVDSYQKSDLNLQFFKVATYNTTDKATTVLHCVLKKSVTFSMIRKKTLIN